MRRQSEGGCGLRVPYRDGGRQGVKGLQEMKGKVLEAAGGGGGEGDWALAYQGKRG